MDFTEHPAHTRTTRETHIWHALRTLHQTQRAIQGMPARCWSSRDICRVCGVGAGKLRVCIHHLYREARHTFPVHIPAIEGELQLASANIYEEMEEDVSLVLPSLLSFQKSHLASLSRLLFRCQPVHRPCLCWFPSGPQLLLGLLHYAAWMRLGSSGHQLLLVKRIP